MASRKGNQFNHGRDTDGMIRRCLLQRLGGGGILLTAGCASVGETPRPFDFAVVNRRERSYHVEFTLWNDADETLVDGAVDIAPRPPGGDEYTRMSVDDIARVTGGDSIEARVRTAGETFEESYAVTFDILPALKREAFCLYFRKFSRESRPSCLNRLRISISSTQAPRFPLRYSAGRFRKSSKSSTAIQRGVV